MKKMLGMLAALVFACTLLTGCMGAPNAAPEAAQATGGPPIVRAHRVGQGDTTPIRPPVQTI